MYGSSQQEDDTKKQNSKRNLSRTERTRIGWSCKSGVQHHPDQQARQEEKWSLRRLSAYRRTFMISEVVWMKGMGSQKNACTSCYVSKVVKKDKKSFQHLTKNFMSTWQGDSKNMKEIEFSQWLFELPAKLHSQFSPSGSTFLPCLSLPSKSHSENSISSIFLDFSDQVDMKNVFKC